MKSKSFCYVLAKRSDLKNKIPKGQSRVDVPFIKRTYSEAIRLTL